MNTTQDTITKWLKQPEIYFQNLWIISFAYSTIPADISSLSELTCLGFVDVSHTNINLFQIQEISFQTHILRLHYFDTPLIESIEHHHGFIINTCPGIWILNGIYICWQERQKWLEFFQQNRHSIVERKWTLDSPSVRTKVWTESAHYWLDDCPKTFQMAVEFDNWKLTKLASSFENQLNINAQLDQLVVSKKVSQKSVILAILLIASLLPEFPILLLQQSLTSIFPDLNPLEWSIKNRLMLLSMLMGRIQMDLASIVDRSKQKYILSETQLLFLQNLVSHSFKSLYPNKKPIEEFAFDTYVCDRKEYQLMQRSFVNQETRLDYDWLRLSILELICVGSNDVTFESNFEEIHHIYKHSISSFTSQIVPQIKAIPLEQKLLLILSIRKAFDQIKI